MKNDDVPDNLGLTVYTILESVHPKWFHLLESFFSYYHVEIHVISLVNLYFMDDRDLYKSFLFLISYKPLSKIYLYILYHYQIKLL